MLYNSHGFSMNDELAVSSQQDRGDARAVGVVVRGFPPLCKSSRQSDS